jgi:hypothetical protein
MPPFLHHPKHVDDRCFYKEIALNQPLEKGTAIIVKGILIPVAWNSQGKVTLLAVADFNEKEYRLDDAELLDACDTLRQKLVELHGIPFCRGTEQWLRVISYRLLQKTSHTNQPAATRPECN